MKMSIKSMTPVEREGSKIKAMVQVEFNGVLNVNARVMEGESGLFVSFPQKKVKEAQNQEQAQIQGEETKQEETKTKYRNYVVLDKESYKELNSMVNATYVDIKDKSKEDISKYFEAKNEKTAPSLDSIDVKMYSIEEPKTKVVGIGSLTLKDEKSSLRMESLKLYEAKDGNLKVACPQYYKKDEQGNKTYENHCFISKDVREIIQTKAIEKYEEHIKSKEEEAKVQEDIKEEEDEEEME